MQRDGRQRAATGRRRDDGRVPPGLVPALVLLAAACGPDEDRRQAAVAAPAQPIEHVDAAAVERARFDGSWRIAADRDRRRRNGVPGAGREGVRSPDAMVPPADRGARDSIDAAPRPDGRADDRRRPSGTGPASDPVSDGADRMHAVDRHALREPPRLPLPPASAGPGVLHVQILLDRAGFSPGVLDGRWGQNTEKAVYWFQHEHGLEPTGRVGRATWARLRAAGAGSPLARYTVSERDVDGPFADVPADIYGKENLDCLCYRSLRERLAEQFHTSTDVLRRLNDDADLDALRAGTRLVVPAVRGTAPDAEESGDIARVIISRDGFYTHALDGDGRIIFHFPSTVGSRYSPSPAGSLRVERIVPRPTFHYTPELFHDVPDERPDAYLPPGANSPVGVVWIQLSRRYYGIHGTAAPQTIGYVTSHGCVRLTNWDAFRLSRRVEPDTPVEFR